MRIAIDASSMATPRKSGVGVCLSNLLDALAKVDRDNDYTVCYRISRLCHCRQFRCPRAENFRVGFVCEPLLFPRSADVFHGGDARLPDYARIPTTVTVHDTFSLLRDDLATEKFREKKHRRYEEIARRADRVIASSESTRRDLVSQLSIPAERIVVNHLGVGEQFTPRPDAEVASVCSKYGVSRPYALAVSSFSRRKNVNLLLETYARLRKARKFESSLVLAGSTEHWQESHDVLERLGLTDDVILTGYVPDAELPAIYSGARMLLFPSLCEGFGLPIVEAMACGTPVLTSNISAMPEIVGDAGLLVDPLDPRDILAKMEQLDGDAALRRTLAEKGIERAKLFTWDRAALRLVSVWKELAD